MPSEIKRSPTTRDPDHLMKLSLNHKIKIKPKHTHQSWKESRGNENVNSKAHQSIDIKDNHISAKESESQNNSNSKQAKDSAILSVSHTPREVSDQRHFQRFDGYRSSNNLRRGGTKLVRRIPLQKATYRVTFCDTIFRVEGPVISDVTKVGTGGQMAKPILPSSPCSNRKPTSSSLRRSDALKNAEILSNKQKANYGIPQRSKKESRVIRLYESYNTAEAYYLENTKSSVTHVPHSSEMCQNRKPKQALKPTPSYSKRENIRSSSASDPHRRLKSITEADATIARDPHRKPKSITKADAAIAHMSAATIYEELCMNPCSMDISALSEERPYTSITNIKSKINELALLSGLRADLEKLKANFSHALTKSIDRKVEAENSC